MSTSVTITPIDSKARTGESVSRRRFQRGTVWKNSTGTMWLGQYAQYVLDAHGVEQRQRETVILCPTTQTKREAQRLLQPYLDRVNSTLATPAQERKDITLEAFLKVWEQDYLSLSKPSTQSAMKSHSRRLSEAFGKKDMRKIDAGDLQGLIARMKRDNLDPKTVRNLWGVVSLVWQAALAQKYVDSLFPKPKLPNRTRKKPKFFTLDEVAKIIAASKGADQVFFQLAAETGLRAGELAGLKLSDLGESCLTVNQTIWQGDEQSPKTENSVRTLALSTYLVELLWEQIIRQKAKGHEFLFTAGNGSPWDMNNYRQRKLKPLLESLGIEQQGFHAFRHFNVSLLDSLRVPLKTIQERVGHALTGSFTLDVYGHSLGWAENAEAARRAGAVICEAVEKARANYNVITTEVETAKRLPNSPSEAV